VSDSSMSRFRRRYWIVLSTVALGIAVFVLAFTVQIASFLVNIFGSQAADWDPNRREQVRLTAIWIAIACFYVLDFALNALQASLRNLLLDIVPAEQLATANAWHGRMINAGSVLGFAMGFLNLGSWPIFNWLGGDQFRKVCVISMVVLIITIWITCWTQEEKARERDPIQRSGEGIQEAFNTITRALKTLPRPVQRVCIVQIFAFMGWFPFLFYGTTWVGEVMAAEINEDPDVEKATQAGDFAMLIYSIVAIVAGTLLPYLASRDHRLLAQSNPDEEDEGDVELARIREMVRQWKLEAARKGKPLKLPRMPFMLRNIWTAAMLLFAAVMASTFFIHTVAQASVAISLLGICWAVAVWVPFAIIMEFLKEMDQSAVKPASAESIARTNALEAAASGSTSTSRPFQRVASTPSQMWKQGAPTERSKLLRRHSYKGESLVNEMNPTGAPAAGGTVLGIHNLAVVMPQFLIALISSAIFKLVDSTANEDPDAPNNVYYGKNGVAWVLRFGGLCALIGALISRRVPPTRTEKLMRARLAEMQESQKAGSP